MVALSERKIAIVRTLVATAPDGVVGRLQDVLGAQGGDSALAGVRRLVDVEATDRRLRNAILLPIAPMCAGDGEDLGRLQFPARALAGVWHGLKDLAPDIITAVAEEELDETRDRACDALTRLAASALRAREQRDFFMAAEMCDRARPEGAERLAACLDLAPVVRRAVVRLPDWLGHHSEDALIAARMAYKDAIAVADDAGPRFFEMMAAQVSPPWLVLRVISAVMGKPTERYLAQSEIGCFGERVLGEIDEALLAISRLEVDDGPAAGRSAGRLVETAARQMNELEACVTLTRSQGWGRRIVSQRKALANVVESCLREAERAAIAALPTDMAGKQRMRRKLPVLTHAPEYRAVVRGLTLLTFVHEIRSSAGHAGFSAPYTRVVDTVGGMIDHYVEDVLDHIKTGDAPDLTIAAALLGVAADFCELIRDDDASALVRRRTAVACPGEGAHPG